MFRERNLRVALVLSTLVTGIAQFAESDDFFDCEMAMPDTNDCEDCKQWFLISGAWHRCTPPIDASECSGFQPNSVDSCTRSRPACPGPSYWFDDNDTACLYEVQSIEDLCSSLRRYTKATSGAAVSGCD